MKDGTDAQPSEEAKKPSKGAVDRAALLILRWCDGHKQTFPGKMLADLITQVSMELDEREAQALERAARVARAHDERMPGAKYAHHTPCFFAQGHDCAEEIARWIEALVQS